MKEFKLPDLGEGLTEAEIVEWHVSADDRVRLDQPLVSVETDKAVVEVPSPVSGRVLSVHGEPGDVIPVGEVLARFDTGVDDSADADESTATGGTAKAGQSSAAAEGDAGEADDAEETAATDEPGSVEQPPGVVGELPASGVVLSDTTQASPAAPPKQRAKAAPSVRALARELGVDLAQVQGSGPGGRITAKDVARAGEEARTSPHPESGASDSPADAGASGAVGPQTQQDTGVSARSASGPQPGAEEKLAGPRRVMFKSMSAARSEVALCTVMDDADIHDWESPRDYTPRLIRAMVAGCRAEPCLNGLFNADTGVLSLAEHVHMGLAMHTPHGLIVATIRNAQALSLGQLRDEVARLKQAGMERALKPAEVRGYTITLSNIAGGSSRYATPLMVPPTVAILGSGAARDEVVAVDGMIAIRRMLPLSLTFDHRCVAGAEASRFLSAVLADLKQAS
ncbi:dihydrolipoamide acetyltransferase family protein [Candidatus Foliamicus sp.]